MGGEGTDEGEVKTCNKKGGSGKANDNVGRVEKGRERQGNNMLR